MLGGLRRRCCGSHEVLGDVESDRCAYDAPDDSAHASSYRQADERTHASTDSCTDRCTDRCTMHAERTTEAIGEEKGGKAEVSPDQGSCNSKARRGQKIRVDTGPPTRKKKSA